MKQTKHKWIEVGERFTIAGVQYSDYLKVRNKIKLGQQVRFIGEPKNLYDFRAIRIEYAGVKIGYVPAGSTIQHNLWMCHKAGSHVIGVITFKAGATVAIQALAYKPKSLTQKEGEVHFAKMRAELSYQVK